MDYGESGILYPLGSGGNVNPVEDTTALKAQRGRIYFTEITRGHRVSRSFQDIYWDNEMRNGILIYGPAVR